MSKYSRGFKYLSLCSFAALLNKNYTTNLQLTAIELARSYLHDCIHNSSFRSFRTVPPQTDSRFPIYREQYGVNFRKPDGSSYSSPVSPEESPSKINLGVLMDGLTVMMTAEYVEPFFGELKMQQLNEFEVTIINDLVLRLDYLPENYRGTDFHNNVTVPTLKFLQKHNDPETYAALVQAMLTGKMRELVEHFNDKLGASRSWQKQFKASSY